MKQFKILSFFTLALAVVGVTLISQSATARTQWELYASKTQLFSILTPTVPDETLTEFRIGDDAVIYNSETLSFVDQRPYKDIIKNYIVKLDQTFGPSISPESRLKIVEREVKAFEDLNIKDGGKVIDKNIYSNGERTVAELTILHGQFDEDVDGTRIKIILTGTSKFHQIYFGPEKDLASNVTNKYFDSFSIKSGFAKKKGDMNEDWRFIESPFSLFSVKIPPVTPPYFPNEPTITRDEKQEKIGMVFNDPIWQQKLFYNVTGYQLDKEMSFDLAETALLEKHLRRHGRSLVGIEFEKDFIGETPYIETSYIINPPKGYEYINRVRLRAMFLGNYMVVQEVVGAAHLVEAPFTQSFFNLIDFTPKKAFQKELQRHLTRGLAVPAQ